MGGCCSVLAFPVCAHPGEGAASKPHSSMAATRGKCLALLCVHRFSVGPGGVGRPLGLTAALCCCNMAWMEILSQKFMLGLVVPQEKGDESHSCGVGTIFIHWQKHGTDWRRKRAPENLDKAPSEPALLKACVGAGLFVGLSDVQQ